MKDPAAAARNLSTAGAISTDNFLALTGRPQVIQSMATQTTFSGVFEPRVLSKPRLNECPGARSPDSSE